MDNTIFLFLIAIVFLIFIVLPQSRRNKKEKNFLNNLKRGDRIITKSGIHARVIEFDNKNNTCVVETMAGKLKIEKAAISLEMSSKLNV
ncbi:MAG: preprotein translocase subunit YajC [Candidatus Marisimplicoccus sp.]|jgi:preprotein translocase subunit YajC|tara:strand:- start:1911 stop:2177 length:267 start_codon:yes stop_codon:yes gene_type:complete